MHCMLLQSRYTSSAKYDAKHMLSYLDFHCYFEANVSDNSSCAQPPPPSPGLLQGICPLCQSRGWGICKSCAARGSGICQSQGQPRAFDTHAVSSHNKTTHRGFYWKNKQMGSFFKDGKKGF